MRTLLKILATIIFFAISCTMPSQPAQQPVPLQTSEQSQSTQIENPPTVSGAEEEAAKFPVTVTDGLGRKVTIKSLPKRIISLAPSNTEILFALGLDDRIIGVTDYCNYPEQAKLKPRVAGYSTPDMEKLVNLAPDLILAESIHEKTVLPALENRGFTVILLQARTVQEILDNINLIGIATGKIKTAEILVADLQNRIKAITEKTKSLTENRRIRVLYAIWYDPIWTMGGGTYADDLITLAGGRNIYSSDFEKSRVVSPESIVARNPQVILVSGMGTSGQTIAQNLRQQPWMQTTDAIKKGHIYVISDADLIERPGPRIVDGLEEVARIIEESQ